MIRVDDLSVSFGRGRSQVQALAGIGFRVADGEVYGLVGESGSGKSTVLRALCGLVRDWSGRIEVAGEACGARRPKRFFRLVQMVFQDPYGSLHPRHTVDQILAEPLAIHGCRDAAERVPRALAEVGLDRAVRFRFPHQLSGGQRQRVAIARALILAPRILLLDEPTSALDLSVQAEVLNLLQRLRRSHGLTMLLVSHDLGVIAHMCDRVLVMQGGRMIEELAADTLAGGTPAHPYTRQLLRASQGYDRAALAGFDDLNGG